MDTDRDLEELIEERRAVWSSARSTYAAAFGPVSAVRASRSFGSPPVDVLEDTVPLPLYRPDRL